MAHRKKVGDVYAVPLPDHTFAFCRVLKSSGAAFYKHRGVSPADVPTAEDYEFVVYVYNHVFRQWPFVVHHPFQNEEEAWPPPVCWVDQLTGKGALYMKGQQVPCSYDECKDLEILAV
ncbi:Imm26 family immunity protein [Angelakisella massiliensis]|uniref:Imm26 family immunity protein n=1 Tax=Angelakisella massiliensis TaxID=1871018 RepID=UPI0024B16CB6|nr:Imm26 family immunity protein [Angelakisella massiliensis]